MPFQTFLYVEVFGRACPSCLEGHALLWFAISYWGSEGHGRASGGQWAQTRRRPGSKGKVSSIEWAHLGPLAYLPAPDPTQPGSISESWWKYLIKQKTCSSFPVARHVQTQMDCTAPFWKFHKPPINWRLQCDTWFSWITVSIEHGMG